MVGKRYSPAYGDIVVMSFSPQIGHEQKGRRPALVVSDGEFNKRTGLAFVCPITKTDNGFLYHVPVGKGSKTGGFIMVEHLKSQDFSGRNIKYVEKATPKIINVVKRLIKLATKL